MKVRYYLSDADMAGNVYLKLDDALTPVPHFHDSVEFIFVVKGKVDAHVEEQNMLISPGDIFFAESYETHWYECEPNQATEAYVLVLSREYTETFRKIYPDMTLDSFLTDKEFNKKMFKMISDWHGKKDRTKLYNHGMASLVFAELFDHYTTKQRHDYKGDILEKQLLEYIHKHYLEDITLVSISKELGFSPEYCSKILHRCLNCGFRTYINSLRLKKADELLSDKSLNLSQSEVLYQCGFSSPSTYYRVKKELKSIEPESFRV